MADETPRRRPPSLLTGAAWWVAPALVMAVTGGWLLAHQYGLWYDELYTAEVVRLPLARLWDALVTGNGTIPYLLDAPPSYNAPYYAVAHLWLAVTGFAADEVGLRLLSLAASIGAVAVFTRAVARLAGDRRVAVVAGLLVATNPFVVQFAAEARGYGLALLGVSAAALGFGRWLDGEQRALLLYGLSAAGAGLAHWFALLVPAAFAAAAIVLRRRQAGPLVVVTAAATLPALSLIALALANGVGDSGAEWIRGVGGAVPRLFLQAWSARYVALLVVTAAAAAGGLMATRGRREARLTAAAWVVLPVVAVTAAEMIRPVFVDRYLLPAMLGLAVLMARGVMALRRPLALVATGAVLAVSVAATAADVGIGPKDDVRSAIAAVARQHHPGEPVVAAARWDALGVDHYTHHGHRELVPDVVLPGSPIPTAPTIWVVRRARGGVKGDTLKLEALDQELASRQMSVAERRRFEGRYADVVVERWESASLR